MLADFYNAASKRAEEYLLSKGYVLRICSNDDPDYPSERKKEWRVVWRVERVIDSYKVQLLIALPKTFPDEFPQVFISRNGFNRLSPIPHLSSTRFLCTYDPVESLPNPEAPGEVVEKFVERGFQVIDDGIAKRNLSDYTDEFLAYWQAECNKNLCILFAPPDSSDEFLFCPFAAEKYGFEGVIAQRVEDIANWCDALKINFDSSLVDNILFLPLEGLGYPPYPSTNGQLYKRLKRCSPHSLKDLIAYFQRRTDPYYVLFSVPTLGGRALGFWNHAGLSKQTVCPGFPRGNVPAELLLSKHHDGKLIKKSIERVDRDRLFARGGSGLSLVEDLAISMIGCGSIGSTLAYSLVRAGLNTLDLVDPEKLSAENIARHYCGLSEIGQNKSQALRVKLRLHYPYLKCNAYDKDVLQLLLDDPSFFNRYFLNIVAIGRLPIEKRLNRLIQNKVMTSTFLFIWVEPLLVAGHALFVNPSTPGCLECVLDAAYKVKYRVVEKASKFFQREAGCQTTYIPYPSMEIDRFVNSVIRFIMSILKGDLTDSTLLTWVGDIDSFREKGGAVSAYWASDTSYTEHEIHLLREPLCDMCFLNASA